jgi:hypothetical protein
MTSKVSGSTTPNERSAQLKLSDVIRIVAPENELFNHQLFFIDYIDEERINLVNMDTMATLKLRIHEGGILGDGTIQEIVVVSRAKLEGYARQHGLVVGKWLDVYFDGPTPSVLTGEITNLESDMIEVRVYNGSDDTETEYLYFNFDYKGLPQEVQINRIELRPPPEVAVSLHEIAEADVEASRSDDGDMYAPADDGDMYAPADDLEVNVEEDGGEERPAIEDVASDSDDSDLEEGEVREDRPTPNMLVANKTLLGEYIATNRNIGAPLDMVETTRAVDELKERYPLAAQTDDLLDDLIMKQTEGTRGFRSSNNLAVEIERFTQLRETFSLMDKYFNVTGAKVNTDNWKPIVEDILHMRHNLLWVVPVTKTVRNIYDVPVPIDEDIPDIHSLELMEDLDMGIQAVVRTYMGGTNTEVVNKYRQYVSGLTTTLSSFSTPDVEDQDIVGMVEPPIDQYSVTNNLTNFRSSGLSHTSGNKITTSRMVKQQYVAPTRLIVTRDPNMSPLEGTERVPASAGDSMAVRSIMTLPYSITRFSAMDRPGTSIDQKCRNSSLLPTYFKVLGRKTKVHTVIVDSLVTPSRYNPTTCDNFTNYQMGVDMMGTSFEDYIKAIVPTTGQLIEMVTSKTNDKLNFHDFVAVLEPYSVYTQDITDTQYKSINEKVNKNIIQFMNNKKDRWRIVGRIKKMTHSNQFSAKAVTALVSEQSRDVTASQYNHAGLNYSNSELLSKMVNLDYGTAMTDIMSRDSAGILVHEKVDAMLDIFRGDDDAPQDKGADKDADKCKMVIIAKQYFSPDEMERDNKAIIYFDRKYDDTNYTLLIKKNDPYSTTVEKFDAEYAQMTPENFFMFIRKKVRGARPNSVPDTEIDHLTETLITGKKRVRDGDYTLLHEDLDGTVLYFKRVNDTWKIDKDMIKKQPTDNAAMNCSLEPGCVYNESAAIVDDRCVPVSETKAMMHANILKEIVNRFDEKLAATAEELLTYLAGRNARSSHLIKVLKARRTRELCKYDLQQFTRGAEMNAAGVVQAVTRSPHMDIKDKILAQKDLGRKYTDLIYFINRYTEECVDGDRCDLAGGAARRWRYCKETKTALLPVFMHELALAWIEDGSDYTHPSYQHTMQRIIREIGAESDDGAYWVDKYSGETIERKEFDTEEGFDNGHKIVSREVVEEDFETRYMDNIRQAHNTAVKYTTHETRTMYGVATTIAGFMNISLATQIEFIVKLASATISLHGVLPSEAEYRQSVAARSVEGQKSRPYETIYGETVMFLTLGAILIGIQTSVPSVVTKKTYPGCVRSFAGYPFDGDGDTSGLAYIACVAKKGMKTSGEWSVLRRITPETIMKKIRLFIDRYYIDNLDVKAKTQAKQEHILKHPDEVVLEENRVEHWTTFMPPLRTVRLSQLVSIANGFKDLLISDIKMGSSAQWSKLNVIQGKIVQFGLASQVGIQQTIDEVKGQRGGIDEIFIDEFGTGSLDRQGNPHSLGRQSNPHSLGRTQLEYFSSLNGDIPRAEMVVKNLQAMVSNVNRLSRALTISCNIDDKNARALLEGDYSEVTIYRAFISICRFNRQEILDDDLAAICGGKPDNFSNSDAISEKIRKLKDDGKVYDGAYLDKLLRASGAKNQVTTQYDMGVVTQVQRLRNVMAQCRDTMDDKDCPITEIMRHLDIVLDTFDYDTYRSSPDVRSLRNALAKQSERMRKDITVFISDHVNMPPAQMKSLSAFLNGISSWDEDDMGAVEQSSAYYNLFSFINTYIHNLTTVFPNAIRNKVDYHTTMSYATAKRNSLSRKAVDAINASVASDYAKLESFYDNPSIVHVLSAMEAKCDTVRRMAEHTPYFTEIPLSGDKKGAPIVSVLDKTTCKMLFEYYMLSTMYAYVELSSDDQWLNLDANTDGYSVDDLRRREESDLPSIDPSIFMSDMRKMRSTTAQLLHQYVRIMHDHKSVVQASYASIVDTNFLIREGEKELITSRLEGMKEQADRDLDNIKKANKQGVWGKGLQKSLRFHVKEDYDNDREFADRMQEIEQRVRTSNQGVTDENLAQYTDDYLADMDRQVDEDEDERDLSRVRGDDADGDPYGEEDEDDEY